MSKTDLRKYFLQLRTSRSWQEQQKQISEHLTHLLMTWNRCIVGFYYPIKEEIDIVEVVEELSKTVPFQLVLPCISQGEMVFQPYEGKNSLKQNSIGLYEPSNGEEMIPDILLVPCLAMDVEGFRLGYGGGYFDRYLAKHVEITTIGVLASRFLCPRLPHEDHDVVLDGWVTENGLRWKKSDINVDILGENHSEKPRIC